MTGQTNLNAGNFTGRMASPNHLTTQMSSQNVPLPSFLRVLASEELLEDNTLSIETTPDLR